MAISPKDFGASFKGFLDQMSAAAPAEACSVSTPPTTRERTTVSSRIRAAYRSCSVFPA